MNKILTIKHPFSEQNFETDIYSTRDLLRIINNDKTDFRDIDIEITKTYHDLANELSLWQSGHLSAFELYTFLLNFERVKNYTLEELFNDLQYPEDTEIMYYYSDIELLDDWIETEFGNDAKAAFKYDKSKVNIYDRYFFINSNKQLETLWELPFHEFLDDLYHCWLDEKVFDFCQTGVPV